ncbi:transporter, lactate permease (LctP) family [Eikenella corrodens ATCC 23834]|uniref:L-lactate permease n=2 Tax=Eikenella corrodens TaxID=539 RepID=C0DRX1_EIKCO|nr:transporter, lactate permease (LctP) family [Eikenella corrodens ATCC 23834]
MLKKQPAPCIYRLPLPSRRFIDTHGDIMSIALSVFPILFLIILMIGFKMRGDRSAILAALSAVLIAIFAVPNVSGFAPPTGYGAGYVGWAFAEGVLKAIFPILIVILMALFSYNVLLESKQIEVIKQQFTNISSDKRIQVLLIVWGFGGLLEGMAGFGTAVAIPAAILIGLGFSPRFSALVSLIGNSVATGFGAVGIPVITLAKEVFGSVVTSEQTHAIAGDVVIQLGFLMFLVPFVILMLTDTSKKYLVPNIILSAVVGGLSLGVQFVAAYFIGAETPAILGSIACIVFIVLYAKMTEKKDTPADKAISMGQMAKAWAVYGFILFFIIMASPLSGPISAFLKSTLVSKIHLPIYAEGKYFSFGWLSNAGLMLFLGAFIGGLVQGVSAGKLFQILGQTLVKMKASGITVICLVAMSAIMSHSSMIAVIAKGLVDATGTFYPLVAPLVGAIGTFATGSDTSSNILFGKLQASVADQLGMNKSWLAAANTAGATGGKIISPQSIAIATAACEQQGQEGAFLRSAMPYAIAYVIIAGITVYCFTAFAL